MNNKVRYIALTGLMAAVIAVISVWQIPLPFGVPLTFQVFAVALSGYVLGRGRGVLATFIYIAVGCVGIPVFTGFLGGIGVILGGSGGFIAGFLAVSFLCGLGKSKGPLGAVLLGLAGTAVCHITGAAWYALVTGSRIASAFLVSSLPYIAKDALLVVLAYVLSRTIVKRIKL